MSRAPGARIGLVAWSGPLVDSPFFATGLVGVLIVGALALYGALTASRAPERAQVGA